MNEQMVVVLGDKKVNPYKCHLNHVTFLMTHIVKMLI